MIVFRVMIIHNIAWSHYRGWVFSKVYEVLKQNNIDLLVVHISENTIDRAYLSSVDLSFHKYPYKILFKGIFENINFFSKVYSVMKEIINYQPDVLIVCGYSDISFIFAFGLQKIMGKKNIVEADTTLYDKQRNWIKEFIKRIILKMVDMGFPKGSASAEYLKILGISKKNLKIIPYVPDTEYVKKTYFELLPFRDKIKSEEKIFTKHNFLFVGRFSPEKNVDKLIKTFISLKFNLEETKSWGLILVGDGREKEKLISIVEASNIKDIYFIGGKSWKEVIKYYVVSDVFILPSLSEPWGLVVNEAMMCGLPVFVSKRCGCNFDIVYNGINGFSFDPFSESELFELMKNTIYGKYDLEKMGKASLKIINKYIPENIGIIYLEAINFLLNKRY